MSIFSSDLISVSKPGAMGPGLIQDLSHHWQKVFLACQYIAIFFRIDLVNETTWVIARPLCRPDGACSRCSLEQFYAHNINKVCSVYLSGPLADSTRPKSVRCAAFCLVLKKEMAKNRV